MNEADLREIFAQAGMRDKKYYDWLRYLVALASGSLAVLVALNAGKECTGIPVLFLKIGWGTLGTGILLGSLALYGEIWFARALVKNWVEEKKSRDRLGLDWPVPIVVKLPAFFRISEKLCYLALLSSVVSIVAFAVLK